MRPVPTWKSTAAAPTPASGGPYWVPRFVTMPSPFFPWPDAHPTRNSSWPLATVDWAAGSDAAVAGDRTAYRPPVTSSASSRTTKPASGLRRLAERRAEISRTRFPLVVSLAVRRPGRQGLLLDEVDGREQADPHHVDEVPVVRHDDRADGLLVGELAGHEGAPDDQQEGDQPSGDVQAVESGGEVEHRAIRRR